MLGTTGLLLAVGAPVAVADDFESSKLSPGIVVQGAGFQSSKLSSGIVTQGLALQGSKLSSGIVVQGLTFQSSKLSVGIVVQKGPSGGVQRAPLTHW